MDKKKAIEILNQALASIQTTRQNHELFMQALNILAQDEKKNKVEEALKPPGDK